MTQGFARGIPDSPDMLDMLASIIDDELVLNIRILQKIYSYLSEEFVHFSTTNHPDIKPKSYDFGGKKVLMWRFRGILFCMEILETLMDYYFAKLEELKPTKSMKK